MTSRDGRFGERADRWVRFRSVAYGALAVFVLEGVARLADGRIARGAANIAFGIAFFVFWRRKIRHEQLESAVPPRARELLAHPVLGSLRFGAEAGAFMAAFLFLTEEGPLWWAMSWGLGFGLLLGPVLVWRLRKLDDTSGASI